MPSGFPTQAQPFVPSLFMFPLSLFHRGRKRLVVDVVILSLDLPEALQLLLGDFVHDLHVLVGIGFILQVAVAHGEVLFDGVRSEV